MPSRHSSSSHSSHSSSHSSHSSSSHSSSLRSGHSGSSHTSSFTRTRTNQPAGWKTESHGSSLKYHCKQHDYEYFPHSWTDEEGFKHEEGYYDENGQHYTNIAIPGIETNLTCSYCGTHMLYKWKEGVFPVCPNCSGQFQIDIIDAEPVTSSSANRTSLLTVLKIYGIMYVLLMTFVFLCSAGSLLLNKLFASPEEKYDRLDKIYVEETGHTCYKDGEDWYDEESDCWFYWNDDISPAQWQYWYTGISDDYPNYGWMEYDDDTGEWWIEMEAGAWGCINEEFYEDIDLWHFEDAHKNPYIK